MPAIDQVPVLSTGHLTQHTADGLGQENPWTTCAVYPEGFLLYAQEDQSDDNFQSPMPDDLKALFAWVRANGFFWVRLDCDGDVVQELPHYEW